MAHLTIVRHPLVRENLTVLRDRKTPPAQFRDAMRRLSVVLGIAALDRLRLRPVRIATPLESARGVERGEDVILVPILRAGLGLLDGMLSLVPDARIGHIGISRNEETLEPVAYYERIPPPRGPARVILLDPMLATGGSAAAAVDSIRELGHKSILLLSIVAAPQGVRRMKHSHPTVPIVAGALDRTLNSRGYILPGLGDAGDRLFGTGDS